MFGLFLYVTNPTFTIYFLIFSAMSRFTFFLPIRFIQCDNGREFDNFKNRNFFLQYGILLRLSCPYTSPQNGKAERSLRTLNDITRTLLIQTLLCLRSSGLKPSTRPHIYLIFDHLKLILTLHLTTLYFSLIQTTPTFVSSVVSVSLTPTLLPLTNFHLVLPRVSI